MKTVLAALLLAAVASAEDVKLQTLSGAIHGTLLLPPAETPVPVVLLIAGSGPTDRNGNVTGLPGPNDSLKMLAEGLATNGIASLRYDKRGIGASAAAGPKEEDLRFDTYVSDAAAWVQQLRNDTRFSTIVVAGHSEGSLIGTIAARKADAFVSIAGTARPAGTIIREQLSTKLPSDLLKESERIVAALERGSTAENVPAPLEMLYRASVQPYMISWMKYDPSREVAQLAVPVLIVQGTTDLQVPVADAHALKKANPKADVAIIDGMNHVLKKVEGDIGQQFPSYSDPKLPVAPELIERVSAFVKRAAKT
ncbi:MAG TPA: alpha/beta fold hydrolase [Thermoanaerobaculia bacterium]|nr:alpha/beta fold hydrolase [Thermoanaerobaculia bacterium]